MWSTNAKCLFRWFRSVHQMEQTLRFRPTRILGTSFEGGPLWLVWSYTFRSVGSKCPFPFKKIVVLTIVFLYPAYKRNNQTCGGLGRVCTTGVYLPLSPWNLLNFKPEFLLNGECPMLLFVDPSTIVSQSGIGFCNSWSCDQLSVNTRFVWERQLLPLCHSWVVFHTISCKFWNF